MHDREPQFAAALGTKSKCDYGTKGSLVVTTFCRSMIGTDPTGGKRRRRGWLIGIAGTVAVAASLTAALTSSVTQADSAKGTKISGAAPAFAVKGLRPPQVEVSLDSFRGRPLVINFFASWCVPCRQEMPALQSVFAAVKSKVAFLGVDTQDIRSDALDLVHETGVRYPTAFDPSAGGDVARSFGSRGLPTTVFISRTGEMLERFSGETSAQQLRTTISRLFKVGS